MSDDLREATARAMAKADGYAMADEPIVAPEDDGFTPPRLSIGNAVAMYSHLIEAAWNTRAPDPALAAAQAEVARLREALRRMIYETTHLSPCKPNGDHDCTIKAETLAYARTAYYCASGEAVPRAALVQP
jgi:hypothetical protein